MAVYTIASIVLISTTIASVNTYIFHKSVTMGAHLTLSGSPVELSHNIQYVPMHAPINCTAPTRSRLPLPPIQLLHILSPWNHHVAIFPSQALFHRITLFMIQSLCPLIHRVANAQPYHVIVYLQRAYSPFTSPTFSPILFRTFLPNAQSAKSPFARFEPQFNDSFKLYQTTAQRQASLLYHNPISNSTIRCPYSRASDQVAHLLHPSPLQP
jgi:hypothetical protein